MILDTKVAVLLGEQYLELPAPAIRMNRNSKTWGQATDLINGSSAVVGSELGSHALELQWPYIRMEALAPVRALSFAGSAPLTYMDRSIAVSGNVLSPLLARPYLLASTLSPVAWGLDGQQLAESSREKGAEHTPALNFFAVPPTDKQEHFYEETVLIPPGYDFYLVAAGENVTRGLRVNGIAKAENVVTKVAGAVDTHKTALIRVQQSSAGYALRWIRAVLLPLGAAAPSLESLSGFSEGAGMTLMAVQPGSYNESLTITAGAHTAFAASITLQEVWPWL